MNLQSVWISDRGIAKPLQKLRYPHVVVLGYLNNHRAWHMGRYLNPSPTLVSPLVVQTIYSSKTSTESKRIMSSTFPQNTVGIIGGVSVNSTLHFLRKFISWSSRDGEELVPFILSSDPSVKLDNKGSMEHPLNGKKECPEMEKDFLIAKLRSQREFLEKSGARCILMPCHISHVWYKEISEGCTLPFLHGADCVAKELKEAKLKPIEERSNVKIGIIARDEILCAEFYQDKLQNQGFEVVLPDRATMEHIINPAIIALSRNDAEGACNLLRVAIQVLLVRAVNTVILASDELQGLLPDDDPLSKHCISPMDYLARSAVTWAKEAAKM